ncbi:hypothetical protein Dimus_000256 [Dionaea muscipula]
MAAEVRGRSKEVMDKIIHKILVFISILKQRIAEVGKRSITLKDVAVSRVGDSVQELRHHTAGFGPAVKEGANRHSAGLEDVLFY